MRLSELSDYRNEPLVGSGGEACRGGANEYAQCLGQSERSLARTGGSRSAIWDRRDCFDLASPKRILSFNLEL